MNEQKKAMLKNKMEKATVISFDVFDTLLFRKTNTPETIFDLVGKHFAIHGFRRLRMEAQDEASRRAYAAYQYPHADMEQIYAVLGENTQIPVDWNEVKEYEIQMEKDALTTNNEMLEMFNYAKSLGKRVVATSDMYLFAATLSGFLEDKGFRGFDHVYCSADEHKAKFNKELFALVAKKENVAYEDMLHIGDKEHDDVEFPGSYGIQSFLYERDVDREKIRQDVGSEVDKGLYKILADKSKGFWYNLGVEVGGPLYMGLYRYLLKIMKRENKKVFFLSRDGYNLYHIFQKQGIQNIEYLYTSRRALTLGCITEMNERDIESLPPYTHGQTVGEILSYLCIDKSAIRHLKETGLQSFDDVISSDQDMKAFKKLYLLDKDVFLARCAVERENALRYFEKIGFFDQDSICFDCGWQGSSQELIERFKSAVGCSTKHFFVYLGIKNSEKSCRQLHGMHYDTFLFDFYKNFDLQADVDQNVILYELFFSAPHESVFYYGENGSVVLESGDGDREKEQILSGIQDFLAEGMDFVEKYDVEFTPQISVGQLKRLIHFPTTEEAVNIGSLQNVDGFARKQDRPEYIAYVTQEQLDNEFYMGEIYWLDGLLKRPDVPENVKRECALRRGVEYPKAPAPYHLEDHESIRNYYRWLRRQSSEPVRQLAYYPLFSVVIPVYNTTTEQLEECFQSVLAQTYENFELILVDDHSSWENVVPVLQKYEEHEKVRVIYRSTNGHISVATNDGIAAATGDYIIFMDCDDTIEPDALFAFAEKLNEDPKLDFLYSDEDKLTEDGKIQHRPFFKPDWSPDLFLNTMYTNHLAVYRTSIVKEAGGLRTAYNGSQDYDFTLRFLEKSDNTRVGHVPKILYHWRERKESVAFAMSSKNYASEAARYAKEDYIRRCGLKAHLEYIDGMSQYRIVYEVVDSPLVSIIIPSKDHPNIVRQCVESIRNFTNYPHYEVIVVDNGSSEENRDRIAAYLSQVHAKYLYEPAEFNFSKMCNWGADQAEGEYLLFLNDDIEVFQPQWLERMLGQAQQKHVGAVGAKLYYPESTRMQHEGVANQAEGPCHSFMTLDDRVPYYFGWNWMDRDCIGVTGACLMVAREKFREVGGFDENLPVTYNDVKLCFALHRKGYYNVIRNDAAAYHHESLSRGMDYQDDHKLIRLHKEMAALFADFAELRNRDPYLNPNLRRYYYELDLKEGFDKIEEVDISGCGSGGMVSIDSVEVTDKIRFFGWAVLEGEGPVDQLERYLVFKDPYGRTYRADVLPWERRDVANYFGREEYLYAGLECILRKDDLRMDVLPYQLGVMTIDRSGNRYLCWCTEINVVRRPKSLPIALGYETLPSFERQDSYDDVQWYLDECSRFDSYFRIRGYAYKRGRDHYRYQKKLILQDSSGGARSFEVQLEERIDVAYSFPQEHFLYYTGFVAYIFDGMLEKGKEYDVILRLQNQFDAGDIRDIVTGQKISTHE